MPKVARKKSDKVNTGHGCDTTTTIEQHSPNVFANNIEVTRKGDDLVVHTVPLGDKCVPHTSEINQGSSSVYCNGIEIARLGDSADAGTIIEGSPNVYAGG